ncbi:transferase [Aureococcus anophagefferens]|nr:transferase [Aureococcus anophagefferens]
MLLRLGHDALPTTAPATRDVASPEEVAPLADDEAHTPSPLANEAAVGTPLEIAAPAGGRAAGRRCSELTDPSTGDIAALAGPCLDPRRSAETGRAFYLLGDSHANAIAPAAQAALAGSSLQLRAMTVGHGCGYSSRAFNAAVMAYFGHAATSSPTGADLRGRGPNQARRGPRARRRPRRGDGDVQVLRQEVEDGFAYDDACGT